ncbi:GTP pyrophosphokinase [Priestia taiwanensis]|uniref:GTP pyrophosphokinase n=1 Tax=Priestia taiwanensis TaxID=1347902 RepID=A0A917AWJ2_9BACI|nr:GTP pyrophosphokinase family protein [Priestia taiwanensis]MBM7364702.1 putative GTP pyrophosphokinase [Priestia taiwanensis]GGE78985.1 GTP pyrophosphokinase [Priestia taiwanensis]
MGIDFNEWKNLLLLHKLALDDLETKINITAEEGKLLGEENPIEHIKRRIKTPESIIDKLQRKGLLVTVGSAEANLRDIAGIRITCSFVSDIYKLYEHIQKRADIEIVETKDYIKNPKPNGYQSLHVIVKVNLHLYTSIQPVYVEVQLRTLAMDFWASLEHKIYYKYDRQVPEYLTQELKEAAESITALDEKMKNIRDEVEVIRTTTDQIMLPL